MNLGRAIIKDILQTQDLRPYLEAGMTRSWIQDHNSGSGAIFDTLNSDKQAYLELLGHWDKHKVVPALELFQKSYPPAAYRLGDDDYKTSELIEEARVEASRYSVGTLVDKLVDALEIGIRPTGRAGDVPPMVTDTHVNEALALVQAWERRVLKGPEADLAADFADFDLEAVLEAKLEMGVPLGIDLIDNEFYGFQPSQLITLLGRQKSTKSTMMLNSALKAWEQGYDVLFYSVELDAKFLRQRLYALGAKVSPERFHRGTLRNTEQARVRDFHKRLADDSVQLKLSHKKAMVTLNDLTAEVDRYRPHVVYIDGFYFMQDRMTRKSAGSDWQANENVAAELKALAMDKGIVVVTSTQAQEKQQGKKRHGLGIEARTIQGGTGLLKASDLVLGLDRDDAGSIIINEVLSRFTPVPTVRVKWDWEDMTMSVSEHIDDEAERDRQRDEFVADMKS